jgi:hypothetical protein
MVSRCASYPSAQVVEVEKSEDAHTASGHSGFLVDLPAYAEGSQAVRRRVVKTGSLVIVEVLYNRFAPVAPGWPYNNTNRGEVPDPAADIRW